VGVDAPKMAPRYRKAVVLDQVLERAREARLARRRAGVVVHEGLAVLVADEEQLLLALALRGGAPELAGRGERDAEERHRDQDAEIGKAAFIHNELNGRPSLVVPEAPLFTSYTAPWSGAGGATTTQLSARSVI